MEFPRRAILLLMIVALVLPILSSCGDDDDDSADPTPTEAAAAGDELTSAQVGYVPVLIYGPVMLAQDKGYLEAQGLDSELQSLAGGADMVTLTASGEFDFGIGGTGPAFFNALDRGVELTVIAPLHFERTPQATPLMVSKERYESGELDSIEELEGKTSLGQCTRRDRILARSSVASPAA